MIIGIFFFEIFILLFYKIFLKLKKNYSTSPIIVFADENKEEFEFEGGAFENFKFKLPDPIEGEIFMVHFFF